MSIHLVPAPARLDLIDGDPYVLADPPQVAERDTGDDGEGYRLEVSADGIAISGGPAGLLAARATLAQLVETAQDGVIPALVIADAPRFAWRAVMIDVARHFFDAGVLREVIDLAALYKLNVLHLHLTDDQGWRLPVDGRPELIDIGGALDIDGGPGGHLTSADLAEVCTYAAERGIAVVPEVDVPGHSTAAMHALPELNADGVPPEPVRTGGVFENVLDLDLPETERFLNDVFAALERDVPGRYVHIGGDEVTSVPRPEYLSAIARIEAIAAQTGRRVVAWNEAAPGLARADSVIQIWLPDLQEEARAAVARGCQVVLSPHDRVYLDMKPDQSSPVGVDYAGYIDLQRVYDWEPAELIEGLPEAAILGVEAPLWTETIRTRVDLFSMLLPRLAAVAELAWSSPEVRDFEEFIADVAAHEPLWQRRGLPYGRDPQLDRARGDRD